MAQVPVMQDNRIAPDVAPAPLVPMTLPPGTSSEATAKAIGNAADELGKIAVKQREAYDLSQVNAVVNDIKAKGNEFFNGDNGVFAQKGENAKGVSDKVNQWFTDRSKEAQEKLTDNRQRTAFATAMAPYSQTYSQATIAHETAQNHSVVLQNVDSSISISQQAMAANYKNTGIINNSIEAITKQTQIKAIDQGWSNDTIAVENTKQITLGIKSAVLSAMDNKDTTHAEKILDLYKDKIDPATYHDLKAVVKVTEDKNDTYSAVSMIAQSNRNPDDTINVVAANQKIEEMFGPKAVQATSTLDYPSFKTHLFGQESGGNYDARNSDTGAIGKYQILPENWSKWAVDAGLPADAPPTPENQEKIADAKLKPLFDKYGPEGAAVAWYAGEQNAQRWLDGKATAIGDNGQEYSFDAPQKNAPSVRQYVKEVTGGGQTPAPFDIDKLNYAKTLLNAEISRQNLVVAQQDANVSNSMLEAYQNGERNPQVFMNMAQQAAGGDYQKMEKFTNVANNIIKLFAKPERTSSDMNSMLEINRMISKANVEDVSTIRAYLYNNIDKFKSSDVIGLDKQLNSLSDGKDDQDGKVADAKWKALLGSNDKAKEANILGVLASGGILGNKRFEVAKEIIDTGKANGRSIKTYATTNYEERQSIVDAWGPEGEKLVSLAEIGFKRGYSTDGSPVKWNGDYRPINTFISDIGTAMKTDKAAERSLDYMLSRNLPLNPETYSVVYAEFSKEGE